jgi:UTP:GlnB (protein PII) uridylyltransferase
VLALDGAKDPMGVPYIELTEADDAVPSTTLRIDSYRLIDSRDYGGSLMLALEAPDTLGLLGALLASLAALALFPIEVHIETRAGRAYDSLWIGAAAGTTPSAQARDALDRMLANSVRRAT